MHDTALYTASIFFKSYCANGNKKILDIGSQNINGSLRDVLQSQHEYIGADFIAGNGVDIVMNDPYCLPFADESVDVITSSSCFEHCDFFWLLFIEMLRVLKPNGICYINAPSNGSYHRFPVDSWRFYPDSGISLEKWSQRSGMNSILLESFISYRNKSNWNDFVAVFLKDKKYLLEIKKRIMESGINFYNGYKRDRFGNLELLNFSKKNEDQIIINKLRNKLNDI